MEESKADIPPPDSSSLTPLENTSTSCLSLRLPIHCTSLWNFSKPLLVSIATSSCPTLEQILDVVSKLIVEWSIIPQADLELSVLTEYLTLNNNPQTLGVFKNTAIFALEVENLFTKVLNI